MLHNDDRHQEQILYRKATAKPKDIQAIRNGTQKQLPLNLNDDDLNIVINPDSNTGVYPQRSHGLGIWGNERVVMSIRVDKELRKQFTLASKALFGSTCNPIESYMATIVGIVRSGWVYPSNTVDIGTIKIERNLRERRKITITKEIESAVKCDIGKCEKDAVDKLLYVEDNRVFNVCSVHRQLGENGKVWRFC